MPVLPLLEDFYRITLALLNRHDTEQLLQTIVESASRVMDAPYAEITQPIDDGLAVRAVTQSQLSVLGDVIRRGEALLAWQAFDTGKPVVLDNYSTYSHRRPVYDGLGLRAVAEIPMIVEGRCIGLLALARNKPNHIFTEEDIHKGMMLAQMAALVLDQNTLYESALREIEERKKAQQHAIDLALERQRSGMLAAFIQDASHEFRTPLSIIQTSLYFINKSDKPEIREQKTHLIEQQVKVINNLVTMLSLQATLDNTEKDWGLHRVNLNFVAESLIEGVESTAQTYQNRFSMTLPDKPLWVHGDEDLLNTALRQIAENALRYTPAGGEVTVQVTSGAGRAKLEIQDNGVGISEKILPHIFKRLYRQDTAHNTPGLGLGLSIAARIIELHGGEITVESKVNVGSTFTVFLPLSP